MPDAEKIAGVRQAQRQGPTIRDRYEAAIADERSTAHAAPAGGSLMSADLGQSTCHL